MVGPFSVVKTLDVSYNWYWDEDGLPTHYYELSFYDTNNTVESTLSDPFNASSMPSITPQELRKFMGLDITDQPEDNTLMSLIVDANVEFQVDAVPSIVGGARKLALKFLSSSYVSNWRSQRLMAHGNINFAIDGVSIQKPYQQWVERAKEYRQLYDDFVWKYAEESQITTPIANAGYEESAAFYVEILHGINNARNKPDVRSFGNNRVIVETGGTTP